MKKKFGTRVKNVPGMMQLNCDIRTKRQEAYLFANQKYDVTELLKYLDKYKKKGEHITFFHAFVCALGKIFYNRPVLNRFVKNRRIYQHNDVTFAFVAKVGFDDKAEEMMIQCKIDPKDNVHTISEKISKKVNKVREDANHVEKAGANSAMDILAKLPNFLRIPIVGFFKWTDKIGYLPDFLANDNIYYSSLILSNLGTFHFNSIHHNIHEFGISSGLATIGEIRDEEMVIDGKKQIRKVFELGVNFDERSNDGFYLIKSLQMLQYVFDHPEMLEDDADAKIEVK